MYPIYCGLKFSINLIVVVRTQFVTIPNWYWIRTLKAQTIKFVERGCSRTRLTLKSKTIQPHVYRWISIDIIISFSLKQVQFFGFSAFFLSVLCVFFYIPIPFLHILPSSCHLHHTCAGWVQGISFCPI